MSDTDFKQFVNAEIPKRININSIPSTGNLKPGKILKTTGIGLGVEAADDSPLSQSFIAVFNGSINPIPQYSVLEVEGIETVESVNVEVKLADNEEIMNKFSDLDGTISKLNNSIGELEGEKETLIAEVERMNALLSKADAKGTDVSTDGDPSVVENKVVDINASFFDNLVGMIK
jgi:hypothetical protein